MWQKLSVSESGRGWNAQGIFTASLAHASEWRGGAGRVLLGYMPAVCKLVGVTGVCLGHMRLSARASC